MALDFTKAVDRVRLKTGDTFEIPIYDDTIYQKVLDAANGNEYKAAVDMAGYILAKFANEGFRERASAYECYGKERFQSYLDYVREFLRTAKDDVIFNAKVYAGGISLSDMQQNDMNPDNNIVPTTDFDEVFETYNGNLRF